MTLARRPRQYTGVRAATPPNVQLAKINPSSQDDFVDGDLWLNTVLSAAFMWSGTSWITLGSGTTGSINSLTGNSGGALVPTAGNMNILGTGSITVAGAGSTLTPQLTGLTNHALLVGAGTATITKLAVGSTGQTLMGSSAADPGWTGSPSFSGSVTAGTSITATLGNITATNGNFVRVAAGNKDVYSSVASTTAAGANSAGKVTLVGGTATVATTAVTASSIIRIYRQGVGATGAAALGVLSVGTISAGVSFVINAWSAADATALQASDVSSIGWEIVN